MRFGVCVLKLLIIILKELKCIFTYEQTQSHVKYFHYIAIQRSLMATFGLLTAEDRTCI